MYEASIAKYLVQSGLLAGRVPSILRCIPDGPLQFLHIVYHGIGVVHTPADAVVLGYHLRSVEIDTGRGSAEKYVGGISIGTRPSSFRGADLLLGFIDTFGVWHWPVEGEYGTIFNLFSSSVPRYPRGAAWPVWFTFASCFPHRDRCIETMRHIDIYESMRYHAATMTPFWKDSFHEFIRRTWAPSRLEWCLDSEEREALFG